MGVSREEGLSENQNPCSVAVDSVLSYFSKAANRFTVADIVSGRSGRGKLRSSLQLSQLSDNPPPRRGPVRPCEPDRLPLFWSLLGYGFRWRLLCGPSLRSDIRGMPCSVPDPWGSKQTAGWWRWETSTEISCAYALRTPLAPPARFNAALQPRYGFRRIRSTNAHHPPLGSW